MRRNGLSQRKRKPSARRERNGERSGSRSSWNGVRSRGARRVENAYGHRVDEERKRAGDHEERTAERRRSEADDGLTAGHDRDRRGQLELRERRNAARPPVRPRRSAARVPSMNATSGITQKTISSGATSTGEGPDGDLHAARGLPIISRLAAPAVGQQPGGQREERIPSSPRERDEAGLRGRTRSARARERVRDRRHLRAAARKQLRALRR